MLKEGRADAYLADPPMLSRLQAMAGMTLTTVDWMRTPRSPWQSLPIRRPAGLLERARRHILWSAAASWRRGILDYDLVQESRAICLH